MNLDEFKRSRAGRIMQDLFSDGAVVAEMLRAPNQKPPLGALQRHLRAANLDLSDPERQHVGRWTAEVLRRYGWKPMRGSKGTRRAPITEAGPLTSGALYEPEQRLPAAERWARTRAILSGNARDLGTLDDFLRERRQMWDEE